MSGRPFWNRGAIILFFIILCSLDEGTSSSAEKKHEADPVTAESMPTPEDWPSCPPSATSLPHGKLVYEIDGESFSTLEEFYDTISNILIPDASWGHNLNAFNDILRGGFGTPVEGFKLVWRNSDVSKQRLAQEIEKGQTVFEVLVEIILVHCEGGEEGQDGVVLELK